MLIKDIEKMEAYTPTEYVNDSEPDLDADNLNKTERQLRDIVAKANEIIDTLKSLISNVSVNSEDTVPSSAVAYKMEQDIEELNSNIQINVDAIEHSESVYSLFKNNLSSESGILRKAKNTVYHFRITGDADSIFGNGHFVAFIMADDAYSVISALILSKWTGDAWSMIFTSYDQTNFTKKLS